MGMQMNLKQLLFTFILVSIPLSASADVVVLKSGDVLNGKLVSEDETTYTVELPYAGNVKLQKDGVLSLTKGTAAANTSAALQSTLSAVNQSMNLAGIGTERKEEKKYGKAYKYESRVAGAASIADGNTNTRKYHIDGEFQARNKDNRFTARGEYNYGESESIRDADNSSATLKYDRFLGKKYYAYANLGYLRDDFQELDGRYNTGAGLGYEFFNTDTSSLDVEAGPNYVHEDFANGNKNDFIAGRWAVDFDHHIIKDRLIFFHLHEGLVSLKNSKDLIIQGETGLSLPVTDHWEARTQVNTDWDNSPAVGKEDFDTTYIFGFGYRW